MNLAYQCSAALPVSDDAASLGRIATATFPTSCRVPLIFRPQSREQVRDCVRVANRDRIAIYPVSTGKNWGYGSAFPSGQLCARRSQRSEPHRGTQ